MTTNFQKGIFPFSKLKNPDKYIGEDKDNIVFRSGYEKVFMNYCDCNPSILAWSSEDIIIPYQLQTENPPREHRYFPDFFIKFKDKNDKIINALVEIKPFKETQKPDIKPKMRTKTKIYLTETYLKNQSKWKAAKRFCAERKWKFLILTEFDLGLAKK